MAGKHSGDCFLSTKQKNRFGANLNRPCPLEIGAFLHQTHEKWEVSEKCTSPRCKQPVYLSLNRCNWKVPFCPCQASHRGANVVYKQFAGGLILFYSEESEASMIELTVVEICPLRKERFLFVLLRLKSSPLTAASSRVCLISSIVIALKRGSFSS